MSSTSTTTSRSVVGASRRAMTPPEVFDVVVIGFGPVGAVAANLLGTRGRRPFVCDRSTSIYPLPRALALDHEAMRILQECGLADAVAPFVRAYPPTEYRGVEGQLISRFESLPEPFPLGWAPNYTFNQPEVDRLIREGVERHSCVDVHLGVELFAIEAKADTDTVVLRFRDAQGGEGAVEARFVIAADGASSTVRRLVGIGMESLDFDQPWIVIDIICDDEGTRSLPATCIQYCDPRRPTTYVVGAGAHRRWEMM